MGLFQPLLQLAFAPDRNDARNRSFGERKTNYLLGCLNLIMKNVSLESLEEARVYLQSNLGLLVHSISNCPSGLRTYIPSLSRGMIKPSTVKVLGRQAQPRNQDPEEGKRFLHEKGNGELYLRKPSGLPLVETT